ncbi:tRNA (adenosine(37)-N6)-threonylcarbamoyltransferase complex dimerization subunit type 1 TsaB [Bacillaceae bacterium W0354]
MITLGIDTSNQPMSVALANEDELIAEMTINVKRNHSIQLMPAIDHLLKQANVTPKDLNRIAVAEGPGSYTGLRIGMTTAKTLAWTLNIPIVAVSSLKLLAANLLYTDGLICPYFDARRGNVFTGLYQAAAGKIQVVKSDCNVSMKDWLEQLKEYDEPIKFVTPHTNSFYDLIIDVMGNQATLVKNYFNIPRASTLISISQTESPKDTHLLIPEYHRMTEAEANWIKNNKKG